MEPTLPSSPPRDEVKDEPEGGLKAWLVVVGAWCAMLPPMGLLNSLGILQAWTHQHQLAEYSESSIAWIYGTFGFFVYLGGAQAGPIYDAYGPTRIIMAGSVGLVAALIGLSFSTEYYQIFLSFGVLAGLSASGIFTPAISCLRHWFHNRLALATGIASTAGGIGGMVFALIVQYTAPAIGFAWAIRIIALMSLTLLCCGCVLLKTRRPFDRTVGVRMEFAALRDPQYAWTTGAIFFVEWAVFIPMTYTTSYALHVGMDQKLAYSLVLFLNLGSLPGYLLCGLLADRLGRFNVMILSVGLCTILTLTLWMRAGNSPAAIICYAVLFRLFSVTGISLAPVCVSQVCRPEDYGKRNSTTFTLASICPLTALPIAGAILQYNDGEFWGLIVFGGVLFGVSTVAFIIARGVCRGWAWNIVF